MRGLTHRPFVILTLFCFLRLTPIKDKRRLVGRVILRYNHT
jgi:hypothetical protein